MREETVSLGEYLGEIYVKGNKERDREQQVVTEGSKYVRNLGWAISHRRWTPGRRAAGGGM